MGKAKKIPATTTTSMFEYILTPKSKGIPVLDKAREVIVEAMYSSSVKDSMQAVNALRGMEQNHIRREEVRLKTSELTLDEKPLVSVEDIVKIMESRRDNGD